MGKLKNCTIKIADPVPGSPKYTTLRRAVRLVAQNRAVWVPGQPDAIVFVPRAVADYLRQQDRQDLEFEQSLALCRGPDRSWEWKVAHSGTPAKGQFTVVLATTQPSGRKEKRQ